MSAIRTYDLSKHYRGSLSLDDLNLEVPQGSIFGLVGPNGAGKTTTIKILMNLVSPSTGRAEILGCNTRNLGPRELTRIGYVSENQQMPQWMTVGQLMAYLRPFYPAWDDALAGELLARFHLPLTRKLGHLSRGMWMKACLASCLAYRPELLILDEPFSGLDPLIREDLIHGILDRAEETTILISSHDLAEIETFASHIAYLDNGRLRFSEEMESLSARFRQIDVAVEQPVAFASFSDMPEHWLQPEATPTVFRFIDSHFHPSRTQEEIALRIQAVRQVSVQPMSLRAIFLALARASSTPSETRQR